MSETKYEIIEPWKTTGGYMSGVKWDGPRGGGMEKIRKPESTHFAAKRAAEGLRARLEAEPSPTYPPLVMTPKAPEKVPPGTVWIEADTGSCFVADDDGKPVHAEDYIASLRRAAADAAKERDAARSEVEALRRERVDVLRVIKQGKRLATQSVSRLKAERDAAVTEIAAARKILDEAGACGGSLVNEIKWLVGDASERGQKIIAIAERAGVAAGECSSAVEAAEAMASMITTANSNVECLKVSLDSLDSRARKAEADVYKAVTSILEYGIDGDDPESAAHAVEILLSDIRNDEGRRCAAEQAARDKAKIDELNNALDLARTIIDGERKRFEAFCERVLVAAMRRET